MEVYISRFIVGGYMKLKSLFILGNETVEQRMALESWYKTYSFNNIGTVRHYNSECTYNRSFILGII